LEAKYKEMRGGSGHLYRYCSKYTLKLKKSATVYCIRCIREREAWLTQVRVCERENKCTEEGQQS